MNPKFNHPRHGDTVKRTFVAFGTAEVAVGNVTCRLRTATGALVSEIPPRKQPPRWLFIFHDVAVGTGYTLELVNAAQVVLCKSLPFTVVQPGFNVSISWPLSNETPICSDYFVPYGTFTGAGAIQATLTGVNNPPTTNDATKDGNLWYAEFTRLPVDNYTLGATQEGGQSGPPSTNLNVQNCAG
jgi:hypothetical protein